jgi:hypothetical protein
MKLSTSSTILLFVALVATVSARKNNNDGSSSFFGKKVLKKNNKSSSKSEPASDILPTSSFSMEESLLTLFGLDRSVPLTKDEAVFLEEVIQDAYNEVEDDYFAKSVLIEDNVIDYVIDYDDNAFGNGRSLLRGSNNNRKLISDQEMCHDENREVIPGCTFEIDFYIDPYCNNCAFDDEPNMTAEPSSVPSRPPTLPPTRDPCNDPNNYRIGIACDDDDDDDDSYSSSNKNKVVVAEESPPQPPFVYPPPPPSTTFNEILPVVPPTIRPTVDPMAAIILKKLKKSPFSRFRGVKNVRVSSSNRRRYKGGN